MANCVSVMTKIFRKRHDLRTHKQQAVSDWLNPLSLGSMSSSGYCKLCLNMRLGCLDLLECTAGKVHDLRWVVVLQMISIMFVIIYLKIRERNIRPKLNHHIRQRSAKSILVQHYKTILMIVCLNLL